MAGGTSRLRRLGLWTVVVLLVVAVLGLGVLWVQAPTLYEGSGAEADAQTTATATTRAGILAVLAASIAALGAAIDLAETRRANLAADQRERYTNAISQLGDDKLDVQLGGIYGLERIAEDSPRDRPTVVEVLSAFVRGHGRGPEDDSPEALENHRLPTDVRAALAVIMHMRELGESGLVDLSEAHT